MMSTNLPKATDTEAFVQAAVLVGFGEQPRRIHEIFPYAHAKVTIDVRLERGKKKGA